MRVIAGRFRSRKLKSVPGTAIRPTPDRLREALFNVLAPRIAGTVFLDVYAGSGAVGIEALSRGAERVILIERSTAAISVIRENLASLGIEEEVRVLRGDAALSLAHNKADIAFIDPPYEKTAEYSRSLSALSEAGFPYVIAQHASRLSLAEAYGALSKARVLKQGDNSLSFYELRD